MRRGVILLVVLALLSLFAVVGLTYVLVAAQYRRTARASAAAMLRRESPDRFLDEAVLQVLVGTRNPASVLGPHSLLEDLYGNDGLPARVGAYSQTIGGTIVELTLTHDLGPDGQPGQAQIDDDGNGSTDDASEIGWRGTDDRLFGPDGAPGFAFFNDDDDLLVDNPASNFDPPNADIDWIAGTLQPDLTEWMARDSDDFQLADVDGTYNGRVLTFLSGPAAGQSVRIAGYAAPVVPLTPASIGAVRVLAPRGVNPVALAGSRVWINGRPFNGTGFGLSTQQRETFAQGAALSGLGAQEFFVGQFYLRALSPNARAFAPFLSGAVAGLDRYVDPAGTGGADEGYDAVDYQNMLLAMRRSLTAGTSPVVEMPSLHRPDLIFHQLNLLADDIQSNYLLYGLSAAPPPDELYLLLSRPDLYDISVPGSLNLPTAGQLNPNGVLKIVSLKRRILLRPLREDHPTFTGSNPLFNTALPIPPGVATQQAAIRAMWEVSGRGDGTTNPIDPARPPLWDVDNDGDGQADSIWVDIGLPVQTARDGRRFKPLAAYLVVDLDSKLNLNAHGARNRLTGTSDYNAPFADGSAIQSANQGTTGQGVGPAEVHLASIIGNVAELDQLLFGISSTLDGRYGEAMRQDLAPIVMGESRPAPGQTALTTDVLDERLDSLFELDADPAATGTQYGGRMPYTYQSLLAAGSVDLLGAYGTPIDLDGDGLLALDIAGQPLYLAPVDGGGVPWPDRGFGEDRERLDDPYELDLGLEHRQANVANGLQVTTRDGAFAPIELERLLRAFDVDVSSLPSRLATLAPIFTADPQTRNLVTTESYDLPVPAPQPPIDAVQDSGMAQNRLYDHQRPGAQDLSDIVRIVLERSGFSTADLRDTTQPAMARQVAQDKLNTALKSLLSPESRAGHRLNLNRPLGDGFDNNGNRVVDEATEAGSDLLWFDNSNVLTMAGYSMDYNGDGVLDPADNYARQILAKHLYVLMMALADKDFTVDFDGNPNTDPAEKARFFAQMAVNAVDYVDRDSIMTSFEYDIYPFTDSLDLSNLASIMVGQDDDPWDVDFNIDPTVRPDEPDAPAAPPAIPTAGPTRAVVWGCERPELLITETMAYHARRTQDTTGDSSGNDVAGGDTDFDQKLRPKGGLYIELFNPGASTAAVPAGGTRDAPPAELYDPMLTGVQLNKMSPGGFPVWRLVTAPPQVLPATERPAPVDPVLPSALIDRVAYFAQPPMGLTEGQRRFWTTLPGGNALVLPPRRFAVLGPADPTQTPATTSVTYLGNNLGPGMYPRKLSLLPSTTLAQPGQVLLVDDGNTSRYPVDIVGDAQQTIQPPVAVVMDSNDLATPARTLCFSVSEPLGGYPLTDLPGPHPPTYNESTYSVTADVPWDLDPTIQTNATLLNAVSQNGTITHLTTVYLQRLADPARGWNANTNPYLVVDQLSVDCTVYNGEDTTISPETGTLPPGGPGVLSASFNSRQRNGAGQVNWWSQATAQPQPTLDGGGATIGGNTTLAAPPITSSTLGYLNLSQPYVGTATAAATGSLVFGVRYSQANLPANAAAAQQAEYVGMPWATNGAVPLAGVAPWLHWPNRPLISAWELLQVPALSPSQWLSVPTAATGRWGMSLAGGNQVYEPANLGNLAFGHLAPYFLKNGGLLRLPVDTNKPDAALYRWLDYVHVPSRYAGTQQLLNPEGFNAGLNDVNLAPFSAPFNVLSNFREPGRVNLNTVFDPLVWRGVAGDPTGVGAFGDGFFFNKLWRSRRGYAQIFSPIGSGVSADFHVDSPSYFSNPFRSPGARHLVPVDALAYEEVNTAGTPREEIDVTWWRSDPATPTEPLLADTNPAYFRDTNRNPTFRYEMYQRLGNTLTNRSNVYAVWVTVGYFQVDPARPQDYPWAGLVGGDVEFQRAFPDGYRLGPELGSEDGSARRHRAFYLIDRTIPVAFERGQRSNTQQAIILRRVIE